MEGGPVAATEGAAGQTLLAQNQLFFECYDAAPDTTKNHFVALLVGRLYKEAPPALRTQIIDRLVQPLGLLSLAGVANGVFSRLLLRADGGDLPGIAAAQAIQGADVVSLVDFAQQVSGDCVDGLYGLLTANTAALTTAAALVLLAVLRKRVQGRR
jgi:hypothetical protein